MLITTRNFSTGTTVGVTAINDQGEVYQDINDSENET